MAATSETATSPAGEALAERARSEAELLRRRRNRTGVPVQPRTGGIQSFPVTDVQKALWLRDHVDPWPGARHLPETVRIHGLLEPDQLQLAVADLVARQESLRTTYELAGGQLRQVIRPRVQVPVQVVDTEPDRLPELLQHYSTIPFDLCHGPLLRVVLLRAAPDDHVLVLVVHHSVSDGRSSAILVSELTELYAARLQGRPAELPPLPIQFADYTVWRLQRLASPWADQLTRYWQARLAGLPPTRLPADLNPPRKRAWHGQNFMEPLPDGLADRVAEFAAGRHSTTFVVYLAAFQTLLARLTGDHDFALMVPVLSRHRPETEHLIGPFVSRLLIRTDLAGQPTFGQSVDRLTERFAADLAHGELPIGNQLAMVEQPLGELTPPAGSRIVQVLFGLEPDLTPAENRFGLTFTPYRYELPYATRELNARVFETATGSMLALQYADERFSPERIRLMFDGYCEILDSGTADPDRCLLGRGRPGERPDRRRAAGRAGSRPRTGTGRLARRGVPELAADARRQRAATARGRVPGGGQPAVRRRR